jgi:hypothetical protein
VELELIVVGVVDAVLLKAAFATVAPAIAPATPSTANALSIRFRILVCLLGVGWCRPVNGHGLKGHSRRPEIRLG